MFFFNYGPLLSEMMTGKMPNPMRKIAACYCEKYFAETPTASMRKLPVVAHEVTSRGLAALIDPGSLDPAKLFALHDPVYANSFLTGNGKLASSQGWGWTPQIRDGVLAINAGQIRGAQLALAQGIAANIAQGFHHATYERGNGYCTFNGLALVAQEFPDLKIGVLDCDQHQGNGTAEYTTRLPNLFNFTIYGTTFGAPDLSRSINRPLRSCTKDFGLYLHALDEGCLQIRKWGINLLIYQAGADPHINDPYGSLGLTSEQLRQRDRHVFQFAKDHSIPILFVLAGGYQEPIESALAPLHVATFEEAADVFCN
jgi:acetoin utilization deacetylase AcuC-like enzyme